MLPWRIFVRDDAAAPSAPARDHLSELSLDTVSVLISFLSFPDIVSLRLASPGINRNFSPANSGAVYKERAYFSTSHDAPSHPWTLGEDERFVALLRSMAPALTELDVSGASTLAYGEIFHIVSLMRRVRKLNISNVFGDQIELPNGVAHKFRQCVDVDLSNTSLRGSTLHVILEHGDSLRVVNLAECGSVVENATLAALAFAARSNLTHLNLRNCGRVSDEGLRILSLKCRSLESLILDNCVQVTSASLSLLLEACSNLQEIDFSWLDRVTDEAIFASATTSLKKATLHACTRLSGDCIEHLARRNVGLIELDICAARGVTASALSVVFAHCRRLAVLRCSYLSSLTDAILAQAPPTLTHLDVSWCKAVTLEGLNGAALRHLSVKATSVYATSLRDVLSRAADLESLDVSNCDNIHPTQLLELVASSRIATFTAADARLSDDDFCACLRVNPRLSTLSVNNNVDLTFNAVLNAERIFPGLRRISCGNTLVRIPEDSRDALLRFFYNQRGRSTREIRRR